MPERRMRIAISERHGAAALDAARAFDAYMLPPPPTPSAADEGLCAISRHTLLIYATLSRHIFFASAAYY